MFVSLDRTLPVVVLVAGHAGTGKTRFSKQLMARAVALRRPMVFLDKIGRGFSERSVEDAFNDEAHRNLVIDGIEMMILGKVPEMVVLDYSAEALDGP